ncbi:MAG TPA: 50S ribosomal protein L9 [Tissierellia bacterium]|jgi:large subunit ribosomal protein L9|nr:50S ribosomal protein L9 [Tissierellia bacterium]
MKIILLENVQGLGSKGEVVEAKDGYARNFLVPRGLAVIATDSSLREAKHRQKSQAIRDEKELEDAKALKEKMEKETFVLSVKAGEEGRIFGSVTNMDIAEAVEAAGYKVDRKDILLDNPIKDVGSHSIEIRLHPEVHVWVKVEVNEE